MVTRLHWLSVYPCTLSGAETRRRTELYRDAPYFTVPQMVPLSVWVVGLMVTPRRCLDVYPYAQWGGKAQAALKHTRPKCPDL